MASQGPMLYRCLLGPARECLPLLSHHPRRGFILFLPIVAGIRNVAGTLLVLGSPGDEVTFSAGGASPDAEWSGIQFDVGARKADFDFLAPATSTNSSSSSSSSPVEAGDDDEDIVFRSGSAIQHAVIRQAGSTSTTGSQAAPLDFSQGSAPYLLGVRVEDCKAPPGRSVVDVRQLGSNSFFVARFVTVVDTSAQASSSIGYEGFRVDGFSGGSGTVALEDVQVVAEGGSGSSTSSYLRSLNIRDVDTLRVHRSVLHGHVYTLRVSSLLLKGNVIQETVPYRHVVYLQYTNEYAKNGLARLVVKDNEMTHLLEPSGSTALTVNGWRPVPLSTSVDNLIARNVMSGGGMNYVGRHSGQDALVVDNTIVDSYNGAMTVTVSSKSMSVVDNSLSRCSSTTSSILYLNVAGASFEFAHNVVTDSVASTVLHLESSSGTGASASIFEGNRVDHCDALSGTLLRIKGWMWHSIRRNTFVNCTGTNSIDLDLSAAHYSTEDIVSLPENFWGTFQDDVLSVRDTVLDGFKDSKSPLIDFETVRSAVSDGSPLIAVALPFVIENGGGSIGGFLANGTHEIGPGLYECNDTLIVSGSSTLILSGGAQISFAENRGIVVHEKSTLRIDGDVGAGLHVLLQRQQAASGAWYGIDSSSINNLTLTGLQIDGAHTGIRHVGSGGLRLTSIDITGSIGDCIYAQPDSSPADGEGLELYDVLLSGCGSRGLYVSRRSGLFIFNATVLFSGSFGIQIGKLPTVEVAQSHIEGAKNYGFYLDERYGANVILKNNLFLDNKGGPSIYCLRCEVHVEDNQIVGNGGSSTTHLPAIVLQASYAQFVSVTGNVVAEFHSTHRGVIVSYSSNGAEGSGLEMSGNVFRNMTAANILDLSYISTNVAYNIASIFERNLETTSSGQPALMLIRDWPSSNGPVPTCNGNIFSTAMAGTTQYYVEVLEKSDVVGTIDFTMSYWNGDSETVLTERIKDGSDELGVSSVDYLPFLLSQDPNGPIGSNVTSIGFLRPGNILSGTLEEGTAVTLLTGNYTATGPLVIDGILAIEPGTRILMEEDASVHVRKGSMLAEGLSESPIYFEGAESGQWGHIKIDNVNFHSRNLGVEGSMSPNPSSSVAPTVTPAASSYDPICPITYYLEVQYDIYLDETTWNITDTSTGSVLYSSDQLGVVPPPYALVQLRIQSNSSYSLDIQDSAGDFGCGSSEPFIRVYFEDSTGKQVVLAYQGPTDFGYSTSLAFESSSSCAGHTYSPTELPSREPTALPTPAYDPVCPITYYLEVQYDVYLDETTWDITDTSTGSVLHASDQLGAVPPPYALVQLGLQSNSSYSLNIQDSFGDGFCSGCSGANSSEPFIRVYFEDSTGKQVVLAYQGPADFGYNTSLAFESSSSCAGYTYAPTSLPSNWPSSQPSALPSQNPSSEPSQSPTYSPESYGVVLENIIIVRAGQGSVAAIETRRPGVYANITVVDCTGGALKVVGNMNSFQFDGMTFSENSGSYNAHLSGDAKVSITSSVLSSSCRYEMYASGSVRLVVTDSEIRSLAPAGYGIYLQNGVIASFSKLVMSSYYYGLLANNVVTTVTGSSFDVAGAASAILVSRSSLELTSNSFRGSTDTNFIDIQRGKTSINDNLFLAAASSESLISVDVDSDQVEITQNRFIGCTGQDLLHLKSAPSQFNFSENALVNASSIDYFVRTNEPYSNSADGLTIIGLNFWDTSTFGDLLAKTFDSKFDTSLKTVVYEGIYGDELFGLILPAPPSLDCVDYAAMTLGCTILDPISVAIPAGLYYASSNIILRHPEASLTFEAGVQVMFAATAAIKVDEGVFKILGSRADPVVLGPTERFIGAYMHTGVVSSSSWGGVAFGSNANSTIVSGNAYVDGSIISNCVIEYGGSSPTLASLSMNTASIFVEFSKVSACTWGAEV